MGPSIEEEVGKPQEAENQLTVKRPRKSVNKVAEELIAARKKIQELEEVASIKEETIRRLRQELLQKDVVEMKLRSERDDISKCNETLRTQIVENLQVAVNTLQKEPNYKKINELSSWVAGSFSSIVTVSRREYLHHMELCSFDFEGQSGGKDRKLQFELSDQPPT